MMKYLCGKCCAEHCKCMSDAFTQLDKENAELRRTMTTGDRNWQGLLEQQKTIEAKLTIATEALEIVVAAVRDVQTPSNKIAVKVSDTAKAALAQLDERGGNHD